MNIVPSLEHAIYIRRIGRDRLSDIPKFCDLVALEPENVHGSQAYLARLLNDLRMDGNQLAIPDHVLNGQPHVRELVVVLLHPFLQRREIRVVMPAIHGCIFPVSLLDLAGLDQFQELQRSLLVAVNTVFHLPRFKVVFGIVNHDGFAVDR
jgi:hypothetical protein